MSHFTVIVVGEDVEQQLARYQEKDGDNLPKERLEFEDTTEENMSHYSTGSTPEWHCSSSSSWGYRLDKGVCQLIKDSPIGTEFKLVVGEGTHNGGGSYYLKIGCKYIGYYQTVGANRSDDSVYFECVGIGPRLRDHPNKEICFSGTVTLRVLEKPKSIPFTEKYKDFKSYVEEYCGEELNGDGRSGYWTNPQGRRDWYLVGGRWSGFFKAKKGCHGQLGERSRTNEKLELPKGRYDIIRKGDVDPRFIDSKLECYAIVKDGQRYAKGKMGWWGISMDDMDDKEWDDKVRKLIKELPDDTLLTIVDCHT